VELGVDHHDFSGGYIDVRKLPIRACGAAMIRDGTRFAGLCAGPANARSALRWQVLHCGFDDANLLSSHLPGAHLQRGECPVLSHGGSGC
jgi:hypothetical protein